MKKTSLILLSFFLLATAGYSQLTVKNLKADIKLFSGLNTSYKIFNDNTLDFKPFGFSYNGGIEAGLKYCFQDSKTDIGLGLAYSYQPTAISYFFDYRRNPDLAHFGVVNYSGQYHFHYLTLPLNFYFNTKSSFVFNCGLGFKFLISEKMSGGVNYSFFNVKKKNMEFIFGLGKRINENISVFFKTNIEVPGALNNFSRGFGDVFISNFNTNLYFVYTLKTF